MRRVIMILVSGLLYLALAVLGWGGIRPFFEDPARVVLAVVLVVLLFISFFAGGDVTTGEREDRSNRWIFIPVIVISLLSGYVPALTDRLGFWTMDGETVRWAGVVVFFAGSLLRLWPVVVLGNRFSGLVAIQAGHTLETKGVYSVIRHPSYLGLLLSMLGWALAFRSGVGLILVALMVPTLVARMNSEEALLQSQFGSEYDAYRSRTSRLIPGIY
ncbi:MAG TPA: isoprenylcysteine carboxylmethyltransferase family protein [Candidatus Aquilonibacter sp.]